MAQPKKQRRVAPPPEKDNLSDSDENHESEDEEEMEDIDVDFDVHAPEASDKLGIKNLLQQLFKKSDIDTSDLADLLIEQHDITGVIKEAVDAEDMDTDDDMDVDFGVFSVVNLTTKKDKKCIEQIRSHLLSSCRDACTKENYENFKKMIEDESKHVGLIINERLVNLPAKISVPVYAHLKKEMNKAIDRKEAYDFAYYLFISKIVIFNSGADKETLVYLNPEEELITEDADFSFEYEVKSSQDIGVSGGWTDDDDDEGVPKRKVMLLSASKWDSMYSKFVEELGSPVCQTLS